MTTNQHLDDPLADLFNEAADREQALAAQDAEVIQLQARREQRAAQAPTRPSHFERCSKCGGSGQTRWGKCFRCNGRGGKTFVQPAEVRAANREQARTRKANRLAEDVAEWKAMYPAEAEWLKAKVAQQAELRAQGRQTWEFPCDLNAKLHQYGSLTDGQVMAIRKCMVRDHERQVARQQAATAPRPVPVLVDTTKIKAAFDRARRQGMETENVQGVKWLKLRLDTFLFSDAPATSRWPACIFVSEGKAKLGRIVNGEFKRSRECTDDHQQRIIAVAADPAAAAIAYGLKFSSCSCCGRELTNPESIARGIGPICAERFFGM